MSYKKAGIIVRLSPLFYNPARRNLHGKALSAAAGTACVRIYKMKPFAIQAVREIENGACQVQYTFLIYHDPDTFVLKDHIIWPGPGIEFKIIHKARAASSNYAYPYVMIVGMSFLFAQCKDLSFGSFGYCYHPDNYLKPHITRGDFRP